MNVNDKRYVENTDKNRLVTSYGNCIIASHTETFCRRLHFPSVVKCLIQTSL